MNDNVFNSLNNLINVSQMGHLPTLASQLGSVHSASAMAKKLMEIECSPSLSAIEKSLSRYDDILKPLHMSGMSAIERAMSDIRPSMEYAHDIMQQVQVATAVPSMLSEVTEVLRSARISSVTEAYERYASVMMSSMGESLRGIDMELLGNLADRVLSESEDKDLDMAAEEIASEYARAYEQDREMPKESVEAKPELQPQEQAAGEITEPVRRKIDIKEVREWLNTIMVVLTFFVTLAASQPTVANTFNQTMQVNNYYVVTMGYDASELNMENYRIINQEVVVRLKHDCHSAIVDRLEEGTIIRITGKYRKWRQIIWQNEEEELCMGWIQNYKLDKFKFPRKAQTSKSRKL